ncbi:MAG: hypothetical protein K0Q47_70 [Sedimentibacter sp.]|jgi:hypothetical protein|nr:hypothetical protein [Sedimentibacter sp.]
MNVLGIILIILFFLMMFVYLFGAVGEKDHELRRHYIMATLVTAVIILIIYFLGGN